MKRINLALMLGLTFACSHFAGCGSAKPELTKEELASESKRMDKEVAAGESSL